MRLKQRLEALERSDLSGFVPWVCVRQYEDQTEEQALAIHEAEHGLIGECNSILRVVVRKPDAACA